MANDQLKDALTANLHLFRTEGRQAMNQMLATDSDPVWAAEWERLYRDHEARMERLILELA